MKKSYLETVKTLKDFLKDYFDQQSQVKVLEAGCGSAVHIEQIDKYQITGIDISQKQLDRNSYISKKICGDIQKYKFENEYFDLIISWFVLEHLKYPKNAMMRLIAALNLNGLLVLALPNIWSVKGLVTKLTPTLFHIWYYKHILKRENSGENDYGPFKTYLKMTISPLNIKKIAKKYGMKVVLFQFVTETDLYKKTNSHPILLVLQDFFSIILCLLSFGKIQKKNHDFIIVLQKTAMS